MQSFTYVKPENVSELCNHLSNLKDKGKIISGGTDVIVQLRSHVISPETLIDISDLKELKQISCSDEECFIGPALTYTDIINNEKIQELFPSLVSSMISIGSPQIRNRGTPGGNIGNASPAADCALALVALQAKIMISSSRGTRFEYLENIYDIPGRLKIESDEFIENIILSLPVSGQKGAFFKLGHRNALCCSIVSISTNLTINNGVVEKAIIALGSVAPKPLRITAAEEEIKNKELSLELISHIASIVKEKVNPISDIRGSAEYRKEMAYEVTTNILSEYLGGV